MDNNKNIYKFQVNREIIEKVETTKKDKDGEEIVTTKNKKTKKPVTIVLKKPTRRMVDEAEEYFAIELSKNVKKGIVTKAMLVKKYADTGGALTEEESKDMVRAVQKSNELTNKIQMMVATKASKEEIEPLEQELFEVRKNLVDLESSLQGVYNNTADARAERSTIIWYLLNVTKVLNDLGDELDYFEGILLEDKLDNMYDKDEGGDPFDEEVLNKVMRIISYWHYTGDTSKEKIDEFIKDAG